MNTTLIYTHKEFTIPAYIFSIHNQCRLGVQPVLITEINLSDGPKQGTKFISERISAPTLDCSKSSPHIAKCYGLYMNSKASCCVYTIDS